MLFAPEQEGSRCREQIRRISYIREIRVPTLNLDAGPLARATWWSAFEFLRRGHVTQKGSQ